MRVNVYAEEMTDRVELVKKGEFIGIRIYLYMPVSIPVGSQGQLAEVKGPFLHKKDDDDSSAITFWGERDLKKVLQKALDLLAKHEKDSIPF